MADKSSTLKYFWNFLLGALGLLFLVNSLQTYESLKVLDLNASRSGSTKNILELAGNTYLAVQNAEVHLREYMLADNDDQLENYNEAVDEVKRLITELQAMGTELPLQRSRFEELLEIINSHDQALAEAIQRHKESKALMAQKGATETELSEQKSELEKQEVKSLSQTMAASRQSLTVLSELINTVEQEEFSHIQKIMDESAQRRKEISQAVLFANCLGIGFIIIIAMLTSRTSRQQAEYAKLLEGKVQERTQALELYAQELSRSNRELQSFAFVASHDLQEPLRKIRAFGDRLQDRYSDQLGDGKDYVERMQNAASRMSKLIEDLLAFSRVSTRRKPFEQVDLQSTVAEVLDDLQFKIEETNAQIKVDPLPTISADPMQMGQLFLNLIGNALKFIEPQRQPVIHITAAETRLHFAGQEPGEILTDATGNDVPAIEIAVQDNGIGFDEQFLDKVFNAFQRLHAREAYEGTGIGLAICRRIVERHGGTITANSIPGEGATFIVVLPLEQAAAAQLSNAELGLQSESNPAPGNNAI
ncbi:ATP-binding protein [Simiduia sp. 21SJ11W-1]|uniref:sensor histidine kinase n=1 Tax=Simiduia sp. 21SJ11W-1 TaxID=2909669 RepID=UPI00209CFA67|nr:ATP-binding protein [Simiduia sp. 21SJ11W-1]UTA48505.1 ATP-binding protein [Simiduia sp. 21SJ11W-1]